MRALTTLFTILLAGLGVALVECDQGNEGDRCNPDLSHDECGGGLSCQQPANCPENYCCPTSGPITSNFCQPGCAGGAAAICAAAPTTSFCVDAGPEAAPDAPSVDAPADAPSDAPTVDAPTG